MSEFINNSEQRVQQLLEFSMGMMAGKNGKELIDQYQEAIENVTPHDMIAMEDLQIKKGVKPSEIKEDIEKIMNVLNPHLEKYEWDKPEAGHPLYYLMQENRELEKLLRKFKDNIKRIEFDSETVKEEEIENLRSLTMQLQEFDRHFVRKENILFPYLEKKWKNYRPLNVMWSLHDDIRKNLKKLLNLLSDRDNFDMEIRQLLGEILMLMYRMIFKEENVVFPVAMETLTLKEWKQIQRESMQMGYVYIEPPQKNILSKKDENGKKIKNEESKQKALNKQGQPGSSAEEDSDYTHPGSLPEMESDTVTGEIPLEGVMLGLGTGNLSLEEVKMMINKLPLDITYVDQNDRVKFFSNPEDRFFPRSKAIIGRTVKNCHPPESVHIVEKILTAFKAGEKDKARFWIQMRGKFILIEYYALRDENGNYRGTIEVSQDLTELRELEGEQRLLDWE
ncbi:DUF438 domain-containing protein [Halanaerobium saccharolyticum]|jgi:hypothetical protein|uniref:PAC domain-containing protein n=1 Tax=Halanaerobium saccharolyticum TaxID=43595 RepID=A0A4R6RQN3_9FIRM|nr:MULTISPECIES: PAS domain-containing protein [Halanaerobium]PUU91630.1 MAG: hypothetical protein CI949_1915 [Halanaerobium sp.]TDP89109.1 hypothetical protein C7957_12631 [Halanaerobium saccharolyticum]